MMSTPSRRPKGSQLGQPETQQSQLESEQVDPGPSPEKLEEIRNRTMLAVLVSSEI
jgi:hypothetical protein